MHGHARAVTTVIFLVGIGILLYAIMQAVPLGQAPMQVGQAIAARAAEETGAANIVAAILLGYRGFDTLGEVTILFVAATAAGLVLSGAGAGEAQTRPSGYILRVAAYMLFPFLLMLGAYIILHGHLTPGGGFQGGAILAAAFFVPLLANPASPLNHTVAMVVEGFAGAAFVLIGIVSLGWGEAFLTPFLGHGTLGSLASAGSLPLLYLAIGLKVGSELAGLIDRVAGNGAVQ
ncbi:MAG: sodium:proton antiporter [Hyphomicrobiales bacterium]|nr:MAG: sodium:proton antiporter [Hyphomicrobiales bacterium]